jgi:hypothetical protein
MFPYGMHSPMDSIIPWILITASAWVIRCIAFDTHPLQADPLLERPASEWVEDFYY